MNYIQIGTIVNTHGLKGEVKVLASTDFKEERYDPNNTVYVKIGDAFQPMKVKKYRIHKGFDLLTFEGLEDINLVEKYLKCDIYSEDFPVENLQNNEFHVNDLLDLDVIQNEIVRGKVKSITTFPQGDYLVVLTMENTSKLVPFRDEFVEKVDIDEKKIYIKDIEGLL